jgi:hypothetical protein
MSVIEKGKWKEIREDGGVMRNCIRERVGRW